MYPNFPTGGQRCIIKQLQHILKHTIPKGCILLCQGRNGYIDSMRSIFRNHKRWVSIHSGQSGRLKYRTRVPTFDKEMMTIMEIAQPDVMRGSRSIRPHTHININEVINIRTGFSVDRHLIRSLPSI
jgi:hypothetical protein